MMEREGKTLRGWSCDQLDLKCERKARPVTSVPSQVCYLNMDMFNKLNPYLQQNNVLYGSFLNRLLLTGL